MGIFDMFKKKEETTEQPKEEKKEIKTKEVKTEPKKEATVEEHALKLDKDIERLPSIKEYDNNIYAKGANEYKFQLNQESDFQAKNSVDYMSKYGILLKGKINDKQMFMDTMKNAEILVRKRVTGKIRVSGETQGEYGIFTIVGMLPEDLEELRSFWMNRVIESNEWIPSLNEFQAYMQSIGKNVIKVISDLAPRKRMKVTYVEGNVSMK